jgi:C4-dicarboxylate-specific signal transduction histidine kinase
MGEMAAGLAHELNQPLAAAANYLQSCIELTRNKPEQSSLMRALAGTASQIDRAGEIIRRMRNFVTRRKPHHSTAAINDLIRVVVNLVSGELRANRITNRFELSEGLPLIRCDRIQIEQVLLNLIRNGIEAMAAVTGRPRVLLIRTAEVAGGNIEVTVADTGCGLTAEIKERLFEPFLSSKADGMGIGLAISRSIIEAHGGRLWIVTIPPPGCEIRFSLPATGG